MFWCHIYQTIPNPRLPPKLTELPSVIAVKLLILNVPPCRKSALTKVGEEAGMGEG